MTLLVKLRTNVRYRIVRSPILTIVVSAMASAAQGEYSVFTLRVGHERIMIKAHIRTLMYTQGRCNAFTFKGFCTMGDDKTESTQDPPRFSITGSLDATLPTDDRGYVKFCKVP